MESRVLLTGAQYRSLESLTATLKKDTTTDMALRHSDDKEQHIDVTIYFSLGRDANIWRIYEDGYTRDMGELGKYLVTGDKSAEH